MGQTSQPRAWQKPPSTRCSCESDTAAKPTKDCVVVDHSPRNDTHGNNASSVWFCKKHTLGDINEPKRAKVPPSSRCSCDGNTSGIQMANVELCRRHGDDTLGNNTTSEPMRLGKRGRRGPKCLRHFMKATRLGSRAAREPMIQRGGRRCCPRLIASLTSAERRGLVEVV